MSNDPIKLAQELIKFPSVTPIDAGIIDFLINHLSPFNFSCKKLIFEDVTNLYARFGVHEPNLCFAGHTDVVPPGNNWFMDPFAAQIIEGKLYGRGACDMKGAVAAFMSASIEFIQNNNFKGSISFLISGNEEGVADNGTPKVLEYLKDNNQRISHCIVGEPTCPEVLGDMIKYGRRGSVTFNLKVNGKQGHVAYPKLADNPIDTLLKILSELKELKLDSGNDDFDPSNLEITDITVGNSTSNIIPAKAMAAFNIRFNNLHDALSLEKIIEAICAKYSKNFSLKFEAGAEAFVSSKNSPLVNHLQQAINKVTALNPVLSTTGGTSDARFIKDVAQVVEFGLINKTAHHVDEHVSCQDIIKLKAIYLEFLQNYFQ